MEMEDQYGIADLRQLMNGSRPPHLFPPTPAAAAAAAIQHIPQDFYPSSSVSHHHHHHRIPVQQQQHYEMMSMMVPRHLHDFHNDSTTPTSTNNNSSVAAAGPATNTTVAAATSSGTLSGLENEIGCIGGGGGAGDGGTGRWPRQETLTLLEIRSRLDHKFKEANQKGPLWDEVSRIMSEEHGYQRSGKKCREKFENLYKYYKKTKEGKAGRQDGKHYRFFRQLEALYGETSNNVCNPLVSLSETQLLGHHHNSNVQYQVNQEPFQSQQKLYCDNSLSLSNNSSSEFESSSTDGENDMNMDDDSIEKSKRRRGRGRRSWKGKIKDFIDLQMRKLMEKQEAWLEKMMRTIESKEQERAVREGEWRKQEAARFEREHKFWENERAWIEARDAALMDALKKLTGKEIVRTAGEVRTESENADNGDGEGGGAGGRSWVESEITRLIQLRIGMEARFQLLQSGCDDSEEVLLWEEIANKMACLGYNNKSAIMCKEKWDSINSYLRKTNKDQEYDNNNNIKNNIKNKKKRKETNSRNCSYLYQNNNNNNNDDDDDVDDNDESLYNQGGGGGGTTTTSYCNIGGVGDAEMRLRPPHDGGGGGSSSPSHSNAAVQENCFRFLMMGGGGGENLWDNYGVKHNKGDQNP